MELLESVPLANLELAEYLNAWALTSYEGGNYPAAEEPFTRALVIHERVLGADHPDTAMSLNNLAALYDAQGRYGEAEPLYQRALAITERILGADHPDTAAVRENYAILLRHRPHVAVPSPSLGQRIRAWLSRTRETRWGTAHCPERPFC